MSQGVYHCGTHEREECFVNEVYRITQHVCRENLARHPESRTYETERKVRPTGARLPRKRTKLRFRSTRWRGEITCSIGL